MAKVNSAARAESARCNQPFGNAASRHQMGAARSTGRRPVRGAPDSVDPSDYQPLDGPRGDSAYRAKGRSRLPPPAYPPVYAHKLPRAVARRWAGWHRRHMRMPRVRATKVQRWAEPNNRRSMPPSSSRRMRLPHPNRGEKTGCETTALPQISASPCHRFAKPNADAAPCSGP